MAVQIMRQGGDFAPPARGDTKRGPLDVVGEFLGAVVSYAVALDGKVAAHLRPRANRDSCPLCGGKMVDWTDGPRLHWRACVDCKRHQEGAPVEAA